MADTHILVVDDDAKIRTLLRNCLEGDGYEIFEAYNAQTALDIAEKTSLDLITLDINLGETDGFEIARKIRQSSNVPIIMVTGKNDVIDRIVGLELGADDYITKPFHVREVLARVKSVLRRSTDNKANLKCDCAPPCTCGAYTPFAASERIRFDGMIAYPDRFELLGRDGEPCDLTSGDFKLLNIFLTHAKRILSREQLMDLIDGPQWAPLDRTIDNQVARLRKKIERNPADPKLIKTVRGIGYSFAADVQSVDASMKRA